MSISIPKMPYRLILYLLFGLGLISIISWLILSHYEAQVALQKELQKELKQDLERSALSIDHFFKARITEIKELSNDQFITNYFANKALGMSMEYGLRASLIQMELLVSGVAENKKANDSKIYKKILILDMKGKILASNKKREKNFTPFWARDFSIVHNNKSLIKLKGSIVYIAEPIFFKEKKAGYVLAELDFCPWFKNTILKQYTQIKGTLILAGHSGKEISIICGDKNPSLPQSLGSVLKNKPKKIIEYNQPQTYTLALQIEHTPIFLLSLKTKGKTPATQQVRYILYFLLGLLLVFLSGLFYLIRSEIKSARLKVKMAEKERSKRLLLEEMNQKLDTEILEKSMAQKSLKQRNELLAGVNEVLLLALRSSSLYELAQAHLKFAQSRTNSPAGFVGLYKGHNQFEFLAMDESVDDTCRLYLNDLKTAHGDMSKAPLLQKAYTTKKIILTNDPGNTLPRPNLPKGHTKIDSLLILPLEIDRNSMVLIALANKFEGFTQKDCDELAELSTSFVTALRQKIMENELKLSEERNRTLVESITEGLIVVNQEAELDYINDNMLALLGLEREQAEGIEIFNFLDVKNQEKLLRKWRSRRIGIAEPYELTWQSAHGSPIHTMVYPRPIIGPKGEFCGSVALITDLTKRKNKESQILQAQKLEAIGQLAAGIAHEINTPTNYVSNNILFLQDIFQDILALLKKCNEVCNQASNNAHPDAQLETMKKVTNEYDLDYMMEEVPNAIAETLDGLEHISQIVRSMKEFAHPSAESLSSINLNDAIQNTVTVAKNEWKYVAELVMDLDPELPRLSCLAGQINQVLLNMIVNAAQAIARKKEKKPDHVGKISIKTRRLKDRLEIIIRDNGEGIAEKLQKRVFEPFFTTKEPGKGTGQGLAISHSIIVEKHKGSISLESTEGEGAQFIITLPLELEDEAL